MKHAWITAMLVSGLVVACDDSKTGEKPADQPQTDATKPATPATPTQPDKPAQQVDQVPTARVSLKSAEGTKVAGTLTMEQQGGNVKISGQITGLEPGKHGFHVHQNGTCEGDFKSAGDHFNPANEPHGAPGAEAHHAGDLGNIEADKDGTAKVDITSDAITLTKGEPNSVVDKAIVVHAKADDLKSQPSGNAGDRVGCAVIDTSPTS